MEAREGWLRAGQELLRRGGARAVKLHPLAAEAGLSTGSFYHHFGSIGRFLDALADHYATGFPHDILEQAAAVEPSDRLRLIRDAARTARVAALDRAMRDWARSSDAAARAVESGDAALLTVVADTFVELGHDRDAARLRAVLLVGLGVSQLRVPWPATGTEFDAALDLLTQIPALSPTSADQG